MSAPVRSPLGDLTNLPENVRRNLEDVATTKTVTLTLSEYNRIVDQCGAIQSYIRKRELEVDTAMINLSARITGLEQRLEQQLRLVYGFIADMTNRNEKSRAQVIEGLKKMIELMEQ